tara:strand:- start:214 stop:540 length:327 start_codon:yes stop_codon:yes gene_type:complete
MKLLQKINWKFRKHHITISPLIIFINTSWEGWGFDVLGISHNLWEGSLLKITWQLPNGAERKFKFEGDFLFLRTTLISKLLDIEDSILWGNASKWERFKHSILTLIFK